MPVPADQYLRQAEHNESFARMLLSALHVKYPDWAVTATFYAAVHYINYYFMEAVESVPEDHLITSTYLNGFDHTKPALPSYDVLKSARYEAQYLCQHPTWQTVQELFDDALQEIKRIMVPPGGSHA